MIGEGSLSIAKDGSNLLSHPQLNLRVRYTAPGYVYQQNATEMYTAGVMLYNTR